MGVSYEMQSIHTNICVICRDFWDRFVLGMSPSGTCDLLSALRMVFESEELLDTDDHGEGTQIRKTWVYYRI